MVITNQVLDTVSAIMTFIAPNAGGAIPNEGSDDYNQWLLDIQLKQEEAARRGFWRRLLVQDVVSVQKGDTTAVMPIQFQRANALYIFAMDDEDLSDPDRLLHSDSQTIFAQQITDPNDADFGLWQLNFKFPVTTAQDCVIWYFATPPKPVAPTDKVLLPGDMIAYGAMAEIFRSTNLEGSQDDARNEFENRLSTYLALEMVPPRNELVTFSTNPKGIDRSHLARRQYSSRPRRVGRSTF